MNTDLRDRRRRQTAREIQTTALKLVMDQGLAAVTTDAIAHGAGISTRTFFNYFPNKQAALLGPLPVLGAEDSAWLATSDRPVLDDLTAVARQLVETSPPDRPTLRMLETMLDQLPDLTCSFRDTLETIATVIGDHLQRRLGPGSQWQADIMSHMTMHAFGNATRQWASDDDMPIERIPEMVHEQLVKICESLSST
ncbi:TetR family transcriptional regulator [Paracoccus sp. 1_MG-2023]|uniref:TetR family transcriptional regulator n=1 Tax=unclassified Paracoccus (in: a-proteobacteria) TaxID=2688777 RepID=UPI001C08287C|nr:MULTISPECIES: TetR family transcriptional regulator [unclassified Paracoccus (in: a-proteobacteria)]MBU2958187.1 TetR/AcrR family transcriptional regulator [Paracoccus sp. C2R09]MDO6668314.1 TetR family transcriptional regulator [Paracoccus sp. 1_MG-2023]